MNVLTSASQHEPLHWAEIPDRPLRQGEVRVDVRAVGVNPVDWKMRQGELLGVAQRILGPRGPFVCGVDFAGEVTAVGPGVSDLHIGQRVVGGTDFSRGQFGSYARQVQVRADQCAVLPDHVAMDAAACLPVAGVTAHSCLFRLGGLAAKADPRALVLGAAGGVGHFAVQLAHKHGAKTVGVCSARNVALVQRLGGIAVDYAKADWQAEVARLGPFDVIVDAVGGGAYPPKMCAGWLRPGGARVLVVPRPADYLAIALPGPTRTVLGRPNRQTLQPLVAALADGSLEVVIQERIPLGEAERAHQISRAGKVVGKLVLVA